MLNLPHVASRVFGTPLATIQTGFGRDDQDSALPLGHLPALH
jgi:hypothetical protein